MINNASDVSRYSYFLNNIPEIKFPKGFENEIIILGQDPLYSQPQDIILIYNDESEVANTFHNIMSLRNRCRHDGHNVNVNNALPSTMKMLLETHKTNESAVKVEDESELQRFFIKLLESAKNEGVSDIHIEVRSDSAKLRYRINGELAVIDNWPSSFAFQLAQVVYSVIASEVDVTFKPDIPQDGIIDRSFGDERLRVRLATIPAAPDGFDMIMRLLPIGKATDKSDAVPLSKLGYSDTHVKMIKAGVAKPVGMTIIAGTTGSGKSTTLKNILLDKINTSHGAIKVITVEDPPEYYIPGATQVPVIRSKTKDNGNPFAAAIRAAMRSDPNILMIGEVRDASSGELLVGAVQSGHQVLSTVHASSAIGIIGRLVNLGIRRDILGSPEFIGCLIYQKLLPVLCQHCSKPLVDGSVPEGVLVDSTMIDRLRAVHPDLKGSKIRFRDVNGCEHCRNGVTGRAVVSEVILPDHVMLGHFHKGDDMLAWKHWRSQGGEPALTHAIGKMIEGVVSPQDVESELGPVTSVMIMDDGVFDIKQEIDFAGPGDKDSVDKVERVRGLGIDLPEIDSEGLIEISRGADNVDDDEE